MGLLKPSSGAVISEFSIDEMAYVPQAPFIVDASIRENMLLDSTQSISDDEIFDALRQVRLDQIVQSMTKGLDTVISSDQQGLSGGQIQRLALSRMFLSKKRLIILDEVTSAVDLETQNIISENINVLKKDSLVLIVAHRKEALKKCDYILELNSGSLRELSWCAGDTDHG